MSIIGSVAGMAVRDAVRSSAPAQPVADRVTARLAGVQQRVALEGRVIAASKAVAVRPPTPLRLSEDKLALLTDEMVRLTQRVQTRHAAWPSQAAMDTVLLWLIHANARNRDDTGMGPLIWRASPRLLLTSTVRGSGKSVVLDLIAILTGSRFGRITRITAPAYGALMSKFQETAIIDEAKMVFGSGSKSLDLQGMMLAGYTPRAASLTAHAGGTLTQTFGPLAYAGKDNLITAAGDGVLDLLDRSITIRMQRASRHYPDIDEVTEKDGTDAWKGMVMWTTVMRPQLLAAAGRLSREACDAGELNLGEVDSGVLRATQIWRPLLAIADCLGGDWPERGRAACEELSAAAGDSEVDEWLAGLSSGGGGLPGEEEDE